jgi:hypothetical protein
MPIYHFNVRDGSDIPDPDGTELPNIPAARVEAVKLAGRLLLDDRTPFGKAQTGTWKSRTIAASFSFVWTLWQLRPPQRRSSI